MYKRQPFALLRLECRPIRFGIIKLLNIGITIGLNLFFLLLCPFLAQKGIAVPCYNPNGGIVYIFISYLIASVFTFITVSYTHLDVYKRQKLYFNTLETNGKLREALRLHSITLISLENNGKTGRRLYRTLLSGL